MKQTVAAPGEPLPAPGATAPLSAGLLHGAYAKCTVNGIAAAELFDWEVKVTQKLVEVTAHGDEWEQYVPLRQGWTGRARGYLTRAGAANVIKSGAKLSASPAAGTFIGYSDLGSTVIFQGEFYAEELTISVPNAMVEQEINFRGSMAPDSGPTA